MTAPERPPQWFDLLLGMVMGFAIGTSLVTVLTTDSLQRDICRNEFLKARTAADSLHVLQDNTECKLP